MAHPKPNHLTLLSLPAGGYTLGPIAGGLLGGLAYQHTLGAAHKANAAAGK